jgi:hypothetical protein
MRKLNILSLLFLLICSTLVYGLEPLKVAYYTTNTAAQNVYVELKDYSNNSTLFIGETFNLTPNDNGIVLVNLQDHGGANGSWSNVDANNINTFYTLDIYVNGSLFAQFRLDQLMISQSNASVFDNSGNFAPPTANSSLGTDPNRWEDAYVGGNTLHIGPNSGDINDTEMKLSYNAGNGIVNVDNVDVLSLSTTSVTVNQLSGTGSRIVTSNATGQLAATTSLPTGDLVGTTDNQTLTDKSIDADNNTITNIENADIKANAAIDATKLADGSVTSTEFQYINSVTSNVQTQLDGKQEAITAGNGLSFSTNTLNVGGSSTIISNATNIEVNSSATGNQVLLSSGTVGTAPTYGALPLGNSNSISGTLPVANGGTGTTTLTSGNFLQGNGTGAVTATKAVPTGNVVGTTDTQTLTNKSIDADNNTITNIENADIKANAGIDATKLADGSVTSSELQYINSVTSNVQTQLDNKQDNLPSQTGNSGRYLTTDGTNLSWGTVTGGSTVSTNSTINGDGSGGSPLGINLSQGNTWTGLQQFNASFTILGNGRLALTNNDNNARDIRYQEPSGTGSQYIGWRAPSVSQNSNYVFPTSIGTAGQVLSIASVNAFGDSATTQWITPAGGSGNTTYTEVTSNTTLNTDTQVVFITGNYTITLPNAPSTGQFLYFYSESTTATLNPQSKVFRDNGADYGSSQFSDFTAGTNLTLFYNGTKWLPIGRR